MSLNIKNSPRCGAFVWILLGALVLSLAGACSSKPSPAYTAAAQATAPRDEPLVEVYPPEGVPAYVKQIQSVRVSSRYERVETEVELAAGSLYTIMAKGRVYFEPTDSGHAPGDPRFVKTIGKGPRTPVFVNEVGDTFVAIGGGRLSLGFVDRDYRDNLGYFDVIVVAWATDDYGQVAEFLQKLRERYPEHPGITQAYMRADKVRDLAAARVQTAIEIEQTKDQLRDPAAGAAREGPGGPRGTAASAARPRVSAGRAHRAPGAAGPGQPAAPGREGALDPAHAGARARAA